MSNPPGPTDSKASPAAAVAGFRRHAARITSDVASPPVLAIVSAALAATWSGDPGAWRFVLVFVGVAVLAPMLDLVWLLRRGRIGDFHLSDRNERIRPFAVSTLATAVATVILIVFDAPPLLIAVAAAALAQTMILFAITLGWQVSVHSATAGGLAMLIGLGSRREWPVFVGILLLAMVAWSRVHLRRHTAGQVLVGGAIGVAVMAVAVHGILWG